MAIVLEGICKLSINLQTNILATFPVLTRQSGFRLSNKALPSSCLADASFRPELSLCRHYTAASFACSCITRLSLAQLRMKRVTMQMSPHAILGL